MVFRSASKGRFAVVITVAIASGCYAPESPTANDEADSSAPDHVQLIESSKRKLAAGDARGATDDLIYAAELAESEADRCPFAEATVEVADQMLAREHHVEARAAYAIAVRFAEDCPHLDGNELRLRQQDAASGMQQQSQ